MDATICCESLVACCKYCCIQCTLYQCCWEKSNQVKMLIRAIRDLTKLRPHLAGRLTALYLRGARPFSGTVADIQTGDRPSSLTPQAVIIDQVII